MKIAPPIPGYAFGNAEVAVSPVTVTELSALKLTAGFTQADEAELQHAGALLADQVQQIVKPYLAS